MADYLIKGETLTAIADELRKLSDGVPNPCTPEQMIECIPNINTKLETPTYTLDYGRIIANKQHADSILELYEVDNYGIINSTPKKTTTSNTFNVSSNSIINFCLKEKSQKGYKSSDYSSISLLGYYNDTIRFGGQTYDSFKIYKCIDTDYKNSLSIGYILIGEVSGIENYEVNLRDNLGKAYVTLGDKDYVTNQYQNLSYDINFYQEGTYAIQWIYDPDPSITNKPYKIFEI